MESELVVKEVPRDSSFPDDENIKKPVIKEEVKANYTLFLTIFLIIYYGSWLFSGVIFILYFQLFFIPYFLEKNDFFSLFINLESLIALILMPLIIITCYLLHLFFIGVFTRIFWKISEKISPSKSGIIPRNVHSKTANQYHLRSFVIKYGKNVFTKGIFPWLSNWFFNFVGSTKIGKGSTIEESVGCDRFIDMGKNCYVGVNSTLASHLIQGVFGNISYFKIILGDNVTASSMNQVGPGSEIKNNSFLLPLASCEKHSIIKGNDNYYFGIPLRKIFRKKIKNFLKISDVDLDKNQNINEYLVRKEESKKLVSQKSIKKKRTQESLVKPKSSLKDKETTEQDLLIDFTTSSAISRVNIKFLAVYIPILWISGLLVAIYWYEYTKFGFLLSTYLFLPIALLSMLYLFMFSCLLFSKLLLILVNLIHKPKEGIFKAEIGDADFEFWMLRTELKKLSLSLFRNSPIPWGDALAFRALGINMDFSSHLQDSWCDGEFIDFGRMVLIGQGAAVMSSMVIGKYLIIKRSIFDDYALIGGHSTLAPGTIIGKDSMIGAISTTTYNQILGPSWIYLGIPA
ncbi:MAG: hypothetical protein ACFFAO_04865, partial [Candidatus Hermodarchaeota archaeon]